MLQSALPPHIIVIIFIRLENRHVLFCVAILTSDPGPDSSKILIVFTIVI